MSDKILNNLCSHGQLCGSCVKCKDIEIADLKKDKIELNKKLQLVLSIATEIESYVESHKMTATYNYLVKELERFK